MNLKIIENVELAEHTTFRAGGRAKYFTEIDSLANLVEAVDFAKKNNLEIHILGGGSNTLFKDGLHNKIFLKICIKGIELKEVGENILLKAGGGESWDKVVEISSDKNFWGIENLSAIPGTVGGAVVQNIGAYGVELKDVLALVSVFDIREKKVKILSGIDCQFGYRESIFKKKEGKNFIVLDATLIISKKPNLQITYKDLQNSFGNKTPQTSLEVREVVIEIRKNKFPDLKQFGTAGSFFKNPVVSKNEYENLLKKYPNIAGHEFGGKIKLSAAWILDKILNLKGFQEEQVCLWKDQPLVVVNLGNQNAEKIISFAKKIKEKVFEETKINFEEEVIVL